MHRGGILFFSLAFLIYGVALFLVSVTGAFWPATPVTDPQMMFTVLPFVLMGLLGLLLLRVRGRAAESTPPRP